jgi:hypothetical protein
MDMDMDMDMVDALPLASRRQKNKVRSSLDAGSIDREEEEELGR